jgi:para-aminobenzoate synthetase/4-amino-4-deoxychorismate lyase
MQVILDSTTGRLAFDRPLFVIRAETADEVPGALQALSQARSAGYWLAGMFAYELGYALEPRLLPLMPAADVPLILVGVFGGPSTELRPAQGRAYAGPLSPEWNQAVYGIRFRAVKDVIAAGDIYQANLSFRCRFAFLGEPRTLYEQLRAVAQAPHCAFVDDGKGMQVVSLSPELFFEIDKGEIRSRPMKGTSARTGDDAEARAALSASAKNRAENLMIVDLIRNDLGRVAQTGSVAVEDLFRIETYPSLHTMVSTVTAHLRPDTDIGGILHGLFPCGSVTGAPKIRAMEILRALETSPRGAYCGALGFFAPDGSARFNVAIRTLTIAGGHGTLGIGGGVVQDSREADEYAECLLKARFYEEARASLELIETLKYDNGFIRLERHLARMAASAEKFGLAYDDAKALSALQTAVKDQAGALRVRLVLNESGQHRAVAAPLPPNPAFWRFSISPERIWSGDALLRHKTSWRSLYDRESGRLRADETVFLNERGEVAEGARSNVFVRRGGRLLTPPVSAGLLPGILRAQLLEEKACEEAVLIAADLEGEVYFGNSLRGLIPGRHQENAEASAE